MSYAIPFSCTDLATATLKTKPNINYKQLIFNKISINRPPDFSIISRDTPSYEI
jgi:hypothetical protein